MTTPFPSRQAYLNSAHATEDSQGWLTWHFNDPLSIPSNYSYLLSLVDFQMAHSFYAISQARGNNTLRLVHRDPRLEISPAMANDFITFMERDLGPEELHLYITYTIPAGYYYSVADIVTALNTVTPGLTDPGATPPTITFAVDGSDVLTATASASVELVAASPLATLLGFTPAQAGVGALTHTGANPVSTLPNTHEPIPYDLTLPDGNFSIYEILDRFEALNYTAFNYTYDEPTNRVTLTSTDDLELADLTPLAYALGFRESQVTVPANTIQGAGIVSLLPITAIYVRTNLLTQNLDSRTGASTPILAKVPVVAAPMSYIQYESGGTHRVRIREKYIRAVAIRLEDESGRLLDRNEQPFQCSLQFDVYRPDRLVRLKPHREDAKSETKTGKQDKGAPDPAGGDVEADFASE